MMEHVVPITDAKARLGELLREAEDHVIVVARHGRPAGVLIGAERFDTLIEELEDLKDRISAYESRESEPDLRVPLDKVAAELGLLNKS